MVDRASYLSFLAERGYREEEVLPIVDLTRLPDDGEAAALLQLLATGAKNDPLAALVSTLVSEQWNVNRLIEPINNSVQGHFATGNKVFPGVFPTRSFNGQSVRREGGYLVLLDTGCMELHEAAAGIFASLWHTKRKAVVLAEILNDYRERRLPKLETYDPPGLRGPGSYDRIIFSSRLTNAGQQFVLAHEHAHVALGHSDIGTTRAFSAAGDTIAVKAHEDEFAADLFATEALVRGVRGKADAEIMIACFGPFLTLGLGLLLEEFREAAPPESTHPAAFARLARITTYLTAHYAQYAKLGLEFLEIVGGAGAKLGYQFSTTVPDAEVGYQLIRERLAPRTRLVDRLMFWRRR